MTIKNKYIHFGVQLAVVVLMIWAADFIIGSTLRHFYFKQNTGWNYNTLYAVEKAKADVMIFGSSKGARQYHPDVFEQQLGMSYYNVSREGYFMLYHEALLKAILKRHKPKLIILDIRAYEFLENKQTYERLAVLLPFYQSHPEMRSIIAMKSKFEKVKLLSSIYPYNSMVFKIAAGVAGFNKERDETIKGYLPNDAVWRKPIKPAKERISNELDSNFIQSYKNFLQLCNEHNISLTVVSTPYLNMLDRENVSVQIAAGIAREYNVLFIDYTHEPALINHRELFADPIHLNNTGAKIMSAMIVDSIKKYNNRL